MATAPSDMPATPNMWCAYETRNQRVPPPRRPACASELSRHSPPTPQGEFAANQYEGHGTYTFPDGSSYEGAFQAGQMHGAGCYLDKQARPAAQRVPSVERAPLRPSRTTHSPLAAHPVATASRRRERPVPCRAGRILEREVLQRDGSWLAYQRHLLGCVSCYTTVWRCEVTMPVEVSRFKSDLALFRHCITPSAHHTNKNDDVRARREHRAPSWGTFALGLCFAFWSRARRSTVALERAPGGASPWLHTRCHRSVTGASASASARRAATTSQHLCGSREPGRRRQRCLRTCRRPATVPTCALTRASTMCATVSATNSVACAAEAPTAPTAVVSVGPAPPLPFRAPSRAPARRRRRSASPPS